MGGAGKDILTGGAGKDVFVFNTALNASTNVDTVTDFSVIDDTIRLSQDVFNTLSPGTLTSDAFHIGGAAADASDRIIYNNATGDLFYDADGSGAHAAIKFAVLSAGMALTHNDFDIV
jgi:serralysin